MNYIKIYIILEGFHFYPQAPNNVSFLSFNHRHLFHIKCYFKISDLNRELEIFTLENELKNMLINKYGSPLQFENMSCEMIAQYILNSFYTDYIYKVEILEDGIGGGGAIK